MKCKMTQVRDLQVCDFQMKFQRSSCRKLITNGGEIRKLMAKDPKEMMKHKKAMFKMRLMLKNVADEHVNILHEMQNDSSSRFASK